jgi:hypothetical protein
MSGPESAGGKSYRTRKRRDELMFLKTVRNAVLATAACGLAAVSAAGAQEISDSHLQAARAAISAIDATDRYDGILPDVAEALKARLLQNNPDLENEILMFVDEEALALAARRGDLEAEAAEIYARALREEDLRAIAEFYRTEAGQALIRNGPIAAREVTEAAAIWQRGIERDLLERVSGRLAEAGLRQAPAAAEEGAAETEGAAQ